MLLLLVVVIQQLSQSRGCVCVCQEISGAGDDESSAPTPFPPAPKYEQELGAFKGMVSIRSKANDDGQKRMECLLKHGRHTQIGFSYIGTGRRSKNVPSPKFQPPESLLMTVDTHRQKNEKEEGPPLFYIFPPFRHRREK